MLQFRIQSTPNPKARKYIVNVELKKTGKVSYQSERECEHVPMAMELIQISAVSQVHFFENCITVTQSGQMDWGSLDEMVQDAIAHHIDEHDSGFIDRLDQPEEARRALLTPELLEIDEILERTIRPGLQADGGDIEPIDMEQNILTVRYLGACGGCPSAMTQTLDAVRHILRDEYDENLEVVAI